MNIVIRTGFEKTVDNTSYQPKTQSKGKQFVEAGHVLKVQELRHGGNILIQGEVIKQTYVSEGGYTVKLEIDNWRAIKNVSCTCVSNKSDRCKHVAALVHYVNHEENWSKTDQDQQWGKPIARRFSKDKYSESKYFCEMFSCSNEFNVMGEAQVHTPNLDLSKTPTPSTLRSILVAATAKKTEFARRKLARPRLKQMKEI